MRSETRHSGDRRVHWRSYDGAAVKTLKRGQGYTEYGLILMLIGLVVIGALTLLGQQVHDLWHQITTSMPR
jgi:pilus assembly protein Flp/PilA